MKIIAQGNNGKWIAEVTHEEVRKVMNRAYDDRDFQFKVDLVIDLSTGYDFRADMRALAHKIIEANHGFKERYTAMMNFANLIAAQPDGTDELSAWHELFDHVMTNTPVYPGRYNDVRVRAVAEFIARAQQTETP